MRPLIFASAAFACFFLAAEETTQTRLAKFGDDLVTVWSKYGTEKQTTVRQQAINDLNQAVNQEIPKLDPPQNTTLQRAVENYANNLNKARALLRLEKMNADRGSYIAACGLAFKQDVRGASDADTPMPARKVLDKLMDWCDYGKTTLRAASDDARIAFFTNLNDPALLMMKNATKDDGDATGNYDKNLKAIRRRFPVSSPTLTKLNQPIVSQLENIAKQIDTLDKKPQ